MTLNIDLPPSSALTAKQITRDWLSRQVLQMIEDDGDFDPDENLIFYGLDSLSVMRLASMLDQADLKVTFAELAESPSLNKWWSLIESRRTE